jgi:hypothetical protein
MTQPHINELRQHLLDTLKDLRNRDQPMEPDRARAVAQVASVLVDTAKVEVDYLRVTGQDRAGFLEAPPDVDSDASTAGLPAPDQRNGIVTITRHKLRR